MLRTLEQFYVDPNSGKMMPGFLHGIRESNGVQGLLQKVARLILTRPGSNYYDPDLGNIFAVSIGGTQSSDESDLRLKFQLGISEVENTIKQEQALDNSLTDEETLVGLQMARFARDPSDYTVIEMDVLVITAANETYLLRV